MTFDLRIYIIVGIFIIICIALMIFNFAIIYYGLGNAPLASKVKKWNTILCRQTMIISGKKTSELKHQKFLLKKLSNADELAAYSNVLQYIKNEFPEAYSDYIDHCHATFLELANIYSRKSLIELTCYTYFICHFPQVVDHTYVKLTDRLISFIDGSSVYCRANIICALCNIGNAQSVVNALQVINDKSLFMHNQLLTNRLAHFTGDKEALEEHLWNAGQQWNDNILVSVIQFITLISNNYSEKFLTALQNASYGSEVRAAFIRYYGKHMYEPVRPVLLEFIVSPTDVNLTIEAISALKIYPSSETIAALKKALSSPRWQIRYSASSTLVKLLDKPDLLALLQGEDSDIREIIDYMLERKDILQSTALLLTRQKEMEGKGVSV